MRMMKTTEMKINSGRLYISREEVLTLRTSLLKMFLRCPAQCFFRYFKGLVVLPRSFATLGSSTHTTAEHANKYKLKKGRDEKLSVLQDVFFDDFKKRKKTTWWLKSEKPEDFEKEGIYRIVPAYRKEVATIVEPLYVEEPFLIDIPDRKLQITGTMDLVEKDHTIRDLKTKKRSPQWDEAIKSFQGKSYRAGYMYKFHKDPKGFVLDCIVRKKEIEVMTTKLVKPSEKDYNEFRETAIMVGECIRKGLFYPRREGNYFCSPHACGYWDICTKGAWRNAGVFTKVFGSNEGEDDTKGGE